MRHAAAMEFVKVCTIVSGVDVIVVTLENNANTVSKNNASVTMYLVNIKVNSQYYNNITSTTLVCCHVT